MEKYMISDAAKLVNVESHVLRYWEEELGLEVHRNQLGHRYYTSEDIELFINVKELKKKGIGLKAIKEMLPKLLTDKGELAEIKIPTVVNKVQISSEEKMAQFQIFLKEAISEVLHENGQVIGKEIGTQVSEKVLKEMDYMMKVQDERDEERYKKLDEVIRSCQRTRQEAAAGVAKEKTKKKKDKHGFWKKKTNKEDV